MKHTYLLMLAQKCTKGEWIVMEDDERPSDIVTRYVLFEDDTPHYQNVATANLRRAEGHNNKLLIAAAVNYTLRGIRVAGRTCAMLQRNWRKNEP